MIFLGNLTTVTADKLKIGLVHSMPFDPEHGFGKTQTELETMGILVDSIPDPQPPTGQQVSGIFINPITKIITYEYTTPPVTLEQQVIDLQAENAQIILALVTGGLM